jgi:hypothetical protein
MYIHVVSIYLSIYLFLHNRGLGGEITSTLHGKNVNIENTFLNSVLGQEHNKKKLLVALLWGLYWVFNVHLYLYMEGGLTFTGQGHWYFLEYLSYDKSYDRHAHIDVFLFLLPFSCKWGLYTGLHAWEAGSTAWATLLVHFVLVIILEIWSCKLLAWAGLKPWSFWCYLPSS